MEYSRGSSDLTGALDAMRRIVRVLRRSSARSEQTLGIVYDQVPVGAPIYIA